MEASPSRRSGQMQGSCLNLRVSPYEVSHRVSQVSPTAPRFGSCAKPPPPLRPLMDAPPPTPAVAANLATDNGRQWHPAGL